MKQQKKRAATEDFFEARFTKILANFYFLAIASCYLIMLAAIIGLAI